MLLYLLMANLAGPAPPSRASYQLRNAFTSLIGRSYSFSKPVVNVTTRIARSPDGCSGSVYSPQLNAVEGLWKWLKSDVINNVFYHKVTEIRINVEQFMNEIMQVPLTIIDLLCVRF